jgi:hypothetical protein
LSLDQASNAWLDAGSAEQRRRPPLAILLLRATFWSVLLGLDARAGGWL